MSVESDYIYQFSGGLVINKISTLSDLIDGMLKSGTFEHSTRKFGEHIILELRKEMVFDAHMMEQHTAPRIAIDAHKAIIEYLCMKILLINPDLYRLDFELVGSIAPKKGLINRLFKRKKVVYTDVFTVVFKPNVTELDIVYLLIPLLNR